MSEYKVGDKVWDIRLGWGKVIEIESEKYYTPVMVDFVRCFKSYTYDGKDSKSHENRMLMFKEVENLDEYFVRPKDPLVKGRAYEVWDDNDGENDKYLAYYTGRKNKFTPCKSLIDNENTGSIWKYWREISQEAL